MEIPSKTRNRTTIWSRNPTTGLMSWENHSWKRHMNPQSSLQQYLQQLGHRFLIVKFRLKLKKVGKTTGPFWCDLNQIPYYYTVEMTNTFKGLDLRECLKNYGWRFVTERRLWWKPFPTKRNPKRQKEITEAICEEALQIAEKRREVKDKRKGKIY